jgi:hypothetical protein
MRLKFFTDQLTAMVLLVAAYPGRTTLWCCKKCGLWLEAMNLENGLVAQGIFGEKVVHEDLGFGRLPLLVGVVLESSRVKDRHRIKCERCGTVNQRYRRG